MSKETASLITSMMRTVVTEGTASRLRWKYGINTDVAGKTGTTQSNADDGIHEYAGHLSWCIRLHSLPENFVVSISPLPYQYRSPALQRSAYKVQLLSQEPLQIQSA
ncbi:MAG: penicillin-binding transpeptidase domain-containing protein [Bacteroidota bacterium]